MKEKYEQPTLDKYAPLSKKIVFLKQQQVNEKGIINWTHFPSIITPGLSNEEKALDSIARITSGSDVGAL